MYEEIEKHGENIKTIFNLPSDTQPIPLCRILFRLENKAHRFATQSCNGEIHLENFQHSTDIILRNLDNLLNFTTQEIPVFVNGDARGYTLKIGDEFIREYKGRIYRDWGGYGIIAPDFKQYAQSLNL